MKERWSEREFRDWAGWRAKWPSAEARLDLWFAHLLATLGNMFRKSGSRAVNPLDIVPDWWGDRKADDAHQPKTVEDWKAFLTAFTKARKGKIIRQG